MLVFLAIPPSANAPVAITLKTGSGEVVEVVMNVNRSFLAAAAAPAVPAIAIAAAEARAPAPRMILLLRMFDSFWWPQGPVVG